MPANSPAWRIGFRAIDLSRVGVAGTYTPSIPLESLGRDALFIAFDDPHAAASTGQWATERAILAGQSFTFVSQTVASHEATPSTIRFAGTVPKTGEYDVYLRWYGSNRPLAGNVPVKIRHADGQSTVMIDERQEGHKWVRIGAGAYRFEADTPAEIELANRGVKGSVAVNAIALVKK
jgi:hypothetical protein